MQEVSGRSKFFCRFLTIVILLCEMCFSFAKADSSFRALEISTAENCRMEEATYGEREVSAPVRLEGRQQAENVNSVKRNINRRFSWHQVAYLTEDSLPDFPDPVLEAVCTETEDTVYGHTAIVRFIHNTDGKKS